MPCTPASKLSFAFQPRNSVRALIFEPLCCVFNYKNSILDAASWRSNQYNQADFTNLWLETNKSTHRERDSVRERKMADLRDVYGNPVRQTDEYGNPIQYPGTMGSYDTGAGGHGGVPTAGGYDPTMGTGYGTQGTEYGGGGGGYDTGVGMGGGHVQQEKHQGGVTGIFHRSGSSSSSSSSEDDGQGGRRRKKKGLKEKIKEKLPGGHKQESGSYGPTTTPGFDPQGRQPGYEQPQKKGIMDKIKEKLPGHN